MLPVILVGLISNRNALCDASSLDSLFENAPNDAEDCLDASGQLQEIHQRIHEHHDKEGNQ
jgi:hypothetical protein